MSSLEDRIRRIEDERDIQQTMYRYGFALDYGSEDEWMKAHPLGFIEQREAMGPDGKYGKWLRTLPAIAKVRWQ